MSPVPRSSEFDQARRASATGYRRAAGLLGDSPRARCWLKRRRGEGRDQAKRGTLSDVVSAALARDAAARAERRPQPRPRDTAAATRAPSAALTRVDKTQVISQRDAPVYK